MKPALRLLLLVLLLMLGACQQGRPGFRATDITGADFGRDFALTDHTGKPRALADFRGRVVVTVDPERDTPEVLSQYVTAFNPRFLALRGTAEETARVAKEFKIIYQKVAGARPDSYTMDHSAGTYIFDTQGRLRLYASYGQGPEILAHDIALLLKQS